MRFTQAINEAFKRQSQSAQPSDGLPNQPVNENTGSGNFSDFFNAFFQRQNDENFKNAGFPNGLPVGLLQRSAPGIATQPQQNQLAYSQLPASIMGAFNPNSAYLNQAYRMAGLQNTNPNPLVMMQDRRPRIL